MEKERLFLIKDLLENNPELALTGSTMLQLRGVRLDKRLSDLDFITTGKPFDINMLMGMELGGCSYDEFSATYYYKGIKVDVMLSEEPITKIGWLRLGSVEKLVIAKQKYIKQHEDSLLGYKKTEKHVDDLIKINLFLKKSYIWKYKQLLKLRLKLIHWKLSKSW